MPISRIAIKKNLSDQGLVLDLNVIQKGWVSQVLGGTFGNANSYSFTDGVLTAVESATIDINVRMTPAMVLTERTPEEVLNFLGGGGPEFVVEITDDDFPRLTINNTPKNGVYTSTLVKMSTGSVWSQTCVVRDIKYNYSEAPATIEFTISTLKPYLEGDKLDFYLGLQNTSFDDSYRNLKAITDELSALNARVDIKDMIMAINTGSKDSYVDIIESNIPYFAHAVYSGGTTGGEVRIQTLSDGQKSIRFGGSINGSVSYGYVSEAYPRILPSSLLSFIINRSSRTHKISTGSGQAHAYVKFFLTKRGL